MGDHADCSEVARESERFKFVTSRSGVPIWNLNYDLTKQKNDLDTYH